MTRKIIFCSTLIAVFIFVSCDPAAENREQMHARAKVISDSMANLIQTALQEAEMPKQAVPVPNPAVDTSGMKPVNNASATANASASPGATNSPKK